MGLGSYRLSWVSPFGFARPRLCTLIVSHSKGFVKGFRKLFFSTYCGNVTFLRHPVCYSCTADGKHRLAQTARPLRILSVSDLRQNKWFTSFIHRSARPSAFLGYRPLTVFIIAHFAGFVKREFFFLRTFFTRCTSSPILVSLVGTSLSTPL